MCSPRNRQPNSAVTKNDPFNTIIARVASYRANTK